MRYKTRRLAIATAVVLATGLTGAGVASAQPPEPDADEQTRQMDQAMEQCTEAMPAEMRDDARAMHEQMRQMQEMMSGMGGMSGMGMGGMGMGMGGMGDTEDGADAESSDDDSNS